MDWITAGAAEATARQLFRVFAIAIAVAAVVGFIIAKLI